MISGGSSPIAAAMMEFGLLDLEAERRIKATEVQRKATGHRGCSANMIRAQQGGTGFNEERGGGDRGGGGRGGGGGELEPTSPSPPPFKHLTSRKKSCESVSFK